MEFDGVLAFAESGPREKRQAQVDGGGIESVNCIFVVEATLQGLQTSLDIANSELVPRQEGHDLSEDGRLFIFDDWTLLKKHMKIIQRRYLIDVKHFSSPATRASRSW